ncbi:MAG: outer membrane protein assembly factor BamA, partial [Opitutaceae bacterium]|nr:outer membrane protein assembly factor BamA [Verrucomicrobiales bacterium]
IRVKEGEPYMPISVDDDVRNLYSTGYFKNIRVDEKVVEGGIDLIYVLQGKLLLTDVKVIGNKELSSTKLRKKITSKVGEPLDEQKLFMDAQAMQKQYQTSGYQNTKVEAKVTPDENTGRGVATFEITESPKVKIEIINFEGAHVFTEKKLRKQIKTKRRWWMSWLTGSGVLKDDQFEDDKTALEEFYQSLGYIDFEIKDVKFDYLTPTKLTIKFIISEGRQYKVGAVTIKGNKLFTSEQIEKGMVIDGKSTALKMIVGATFTPGGLNLDVDGIKDYYGTKGYIDARVRAIKNPNVTTGTMDLIFEILENEKAYIEKIEIQGNTKTRDKVIRRELAVSPGEIYDSVRVKLSKQRLEGLQFFEKVDTQAEETDVQNRKNLVIGVEEKNTGNFTIGAGISSVDSIVGFAEVSQGNFDLFKPPTFTGGGQKMRLRVSIGTERQDYQVTFIEPWFLDRKLSLQTDLFHRDLNFQSDVYDETQTGATVSLMKALGSDFLIGRVGYTIEQIGINLTTTNGVSQEIAQEQGDRLVSKVFGSLAYDTRSGGYLPNHGQRTELIVEVAGGPFGGETDFYKLELKTAWYFPGFFPGHVLELNARGGVVEQYGDDTFVPLFDRWYLGGLYSLRGFKYREVGPRDQFGNPVGGRTYVFGSAEYSVPIIERLRFAVFYDVGNVYYDAYSFKTYAKWGQTVPYSDNFGFGLRINLPIGPLRLDYGIPIHHDEGVSSNGRVQFGVGYTRDF